ncbi:hypothetical protein ACVIU4_002720 [Bradyrhizobium barranii subsp. barranii]
MRIMRAPGLSFDSGNDIAQLRLVAVSEMSGSSEMR